MADNRHSLHVNHGPRPDMPPAERPDPDRSRLLRSLGYRPIVVSPRPGIDLSAEATEQRLVTAAVLARKMAADALAEARARAASSPTPRPATEVASRSWRPSDVIVDVVANPKRPGSASYDRFAHWRVGETIQQAMDRGITKGDVAWDMQRGFVTVRES